MYLFVYISKDCVTVHCRQLAFYSPFNPLLLTPQCPVVELLDNPEDRGKYQTMRSIAAFNVEVHVFSFDVVSSHVVTPFDLYSSTHDRNTVEVLDTDSSMWFYPCSLTMVAMATATTLSLRLQRWSRWIRSCTTTMPLGILAPKGLNKLLLLWKQLYPVSRVVYSKISLLFNMHELSRYLETKYHANLYMLSLSVQLIISRWVFVWYVSEEETFLLTLVCKLLLISAIDITLQCVLIQWLAALILPPQQVATFGPCQWHWAVSSSSTLSLVSGSLTSTGGSK